MKVLLPYLVLVLIHHFLLAPLIRKRLPLYLGLILALLVLFGVWCFSPVSRPQGAPPFPEQREMMPPPPPGPEGRGPEPRWQRGLLSPEVSRLIMGILFVGVDLGAVNLGQSGLLGSVCLRHQVQAVVGVGDQHNAEVEDAPQISDKLFHKEKIKRF